VEKKWEHWTKAFILFINLRKACDSVPRQAMCLALTKIGVPRSTIQLIQSFHQGMQATIQLDGALMNSITANNGLRQGCCMASVLFNLYSCLFVEHWVERVVGTAGVGETVKYKHGRKLFRRYTHNADEATVGSMISSLQMMQLYLPPAEGAPYMYNSR